MVGPSYQTVLTRPTPTQDAVLFKSLSDAASFALTFAFGPLMGAISDSTGRKPIALLSQVTSFVPSMLLVLTGSLGASLLPYFVFQGASGIVPSIVIFQTCLSDVCHPANRARAFGAFFAFFTAGLLMSAGFGATMKAAVAFIASAVVGLLGVMLTGTMPETLSAHRRVAYSSVDVR